MCKNHKFAANYRLLTEDLPVKKKEIEIGAFLYPKRVRKQYIYWIKLYTIWLQIVLLYFLICWVWSFSSCFHLHVKENYSGLDTSQHLNVFKPRFQFWFDCLCWNICFERLWKQSFFTWLGNNFKQLNFKFNSVSVRRHNKIGVVPLDKSFLCLLMQLLDKHYEHAESAQSFIVGQTMFFLVQIIPLTYCSVGRL